MTVLRKMFIIGREILFSEWSPYLNTSVRALLYVPTGRQFPKTLVKGLG